MSKLLFVCGFPGGGTDLTKTILNAHPNIYINGEMPFLKNIAHYGYSQETIFTHISEIRAFQRVLAQINTWSNIENINYDFSIEMDAKGVLRLDQVLQICFSRHNSQIWGNKTPQNTENIALLSTLFPDARFLIVTRDVRDVCLSWKNKWGKDMIWCAAKWTQRMKKGWLATQYILPERYLFVKFEDILSDTETACRKICHFLDIPFSDRMLEHHEHTTRKIDGKLNYGQPVKKDNKRKWEKQLSVETVRRIEEITLDTMNLLDYEAKYATTRQPISDWETWRGKWNDWWALLLVGNRASQQNGIGRRLQDLAFEFKKQFVK